MPQRSRALFLARTAMGLPLVRNSARFVVVAAAVAGAGFGAALVAFAPTSGNPGPLGPLAAAIVSAAVTGGAAQVLALRVERKRQQGDFARLARRLGEEKTARSDLRSALRHMAVAMDTAMGEILGHDDTRRTGAGLARGLAGRGPESVRSWRERRLRRIARAAALFGGIDLELKRLALAGPCAEVIEEYRKRVGPDFEILYIEDGGGDWLSAPIDRSLFVLLLRELLDNAFFHAGRWNRVTVTTEPVAGAIVLRVRDDGRGIPEDTLAAVARGIPSAAHTGFGLLLARAIVEAHGGSMRIESESGRGTSVTLRFPTHE